MTAFDLAALLSRNDVVEVAARAHWEAATPGWSWGGVKPDERDVFRKHMRSALAAVLSMAGERSVPRHGRFTDQQGRQWRRKPEDEFWCHVDENLRHFHRTSAELLTANPLAGHVEATYTREEVDRAVRLAEDRNGKPRDWHLFIDEPEADL